MNLNSDDKAVIERALQEAMNNDMDDQSIMAYQEVLNKLKGKSNQTTNKQMDTNTNPKDGFRYDYDDASDLY
jgi:hypothetical protein